jgi:hypothetical protein
VVQEVLGLFPVAGSGAGQQHPGPFEVCSGQPGRGGDAFLGGGGGTEVGLGLFPVAGDGGQQAEMEGNWAGRPSRRTPPR